MSTAVNPNAQGWPDGLAGIVGIASSLNRPIPLGNLPI
jgi:hypothetical protein